jgi:hypothetical protein
MAGPIKPDEVGKQKTARIPEEVFEAFNELIAQHWNGSSATIIQSEVANIAVEKLKVRMPEITRQTLFDENWMDVEESYRMAGWTVEYDKPGYNETYEANFTFRKSRKQSTFSDGE